MQTYRRPMGKADAARRAARMRKYVLIAVIVLTGMVASFMCLRADHGMRLEFGEDALTVIAPDQSFATIAYGDIRHVNLLTNPAYGSCVFGGQEKGCWYGTWNNDQWQHYHLCVHPGVNTCLAIMTDAGAYVVNGKSDPDTATIKSQLERVMSGQAL